MTAILEEVRRNSDEKSQLCSGASRQTVPPFAKTEFASKRHLKPFSIPIQSHDHRGRVCIDRFSMALNPRRGIEAFHDVSKMCQISVFRCPSSSIRAFCREYNESNQATSSGSSG